MRTHSSNNKKEPTKKSKRGAIYGALVGTACLLVALAIILPITLSSPTVNNRPPVDEDVTYPDPEPTVTMPLENFSFGMMPSLNRAVFHSSMNVWRTHNGVNMLAPAGSEVFSVKAGRVAKVDRTLLDGGIVYIEHADGLQSRFYGLSQDIAVSVDDDVKVGDRIGFVAVSRPRARSEGSHIHLAMQRNGSFINPLDYLPYGEEK